MSEKIPERIAWAIQILDVAPDDQLLEIGCGTGVAVSLICEKLVRGKIMAIDQSETMISRAMNRNHQHIASGKVEFYAVSLAEAHFKKQKFNKIFAINVNLFWLQPARELEIIKERLTARGNLYLFYQPPHESKIQEIVDRLTIILPHNEFNVTGVSFKKLEPVSVVCIQAKAP